MNYADWIEAYKARQPVLGRCRQATEEMAKAFPELKRVAGHVYTLDWGRRAHWWCETSEGQIVDPTASQFPMISYYEPFVPGTEVRTGRCMNCGEDLYEVVLSLDEEPRKRTFCDDRCYQAMADEVGW